MTLKLYYWEVVDSLEDHAPGYAFALASSKEEAIDMIVRSYEGPRSQPLAAELTENEPDVYDSPVGLAIMGSA